MIFQSSSGSIILCGCWLLSLSAKQSVDGFASAHVLAFSNRQSALPNTIGLQGRNQISTTTNGLLCSVPVFQTSTQLQSLLDPCLMILRGGGKAAIDLGSESFKLQSMAQYSTITALIMNASLRLYTSQKFARGPVAAGESAKKGTKPTIRPAEYLFNASTTLCILSGVFTALLFNILGIYSKESLGLANHAGYVAFRDATAGYRQWGFRCFLITCKSFVFAFLLSVYERTREGDRKGQFILVASVVLGLLGAYHIQGVLTLATELIFTPTNCAVNNLAS